MQTTGLTNAEKVGMHLRKRAKKVAENEEHSESTDEKKSEKIQKKRDKKSKRKSKFVINKKGEGKIIWTRNRKKRAVTDCPHTEKEHYAKGMCNQCYHIQGRSQKATLCQHVDQMAYAKGKCQKCYFVDYNLLKTMRRQETLIAQQEQ